jgi:hypothetical protein
MTILDIRRKHGSPEFQGKFGETPVHRRDLVRAQDDPVGFRRKIGETHVTSRPITGSTSESRPVMLSMAPRRRPAHERYAAAAKRVQRRITLALESGNYDQVRTLSATLQTLVKKAAEVKPVDAMHARPRRSRR